MLGFFKNLLGKNEAKPAAPAAAPRPVAIPAPAAAPPVKPPTQRLGDPGIPRATGAGLTRTKGKMERVLLPLKVITDNLHPDLQSIIATPPADSVIVALPVDTILSQLPHGRVQVAIADLRRVAPAGIFVTDTTRDLETVDIPLPDLLAKLDPTLLQRRTQRKVELPTDIAGVFAKQGTIMGPPAEMAPPEIPAPAVSRPPAPPVPSPSIPSAPVPPPMPPAAPAQETPAEMRKLTASDEMRSLFQRSAAPEPPRVEPPASPIQPPQPPAYSRPPSIAPEPKAPVTLNFAPPPEPEPEPESGVAPGVRLRFDTPPPEAPEREPERPAPPVQPQRIRQAVEESPVPSIAREMKMHLEPQQIAPEPAAPVAPLPPPVAPEPVAPRSVVPEPEPQPEPVAVFKPEPAPSPAPTAPPPPAQPGADAVQVPFSKVANYWPGDILMEAATLGPEAAFFIPSAELGAALKRGKAAFTWDQLRSWLVPAPTSDTAHGEQVLDLPLPVIAPLFMASMKPNRPQQRVTVDESIPDPFSAMPKAPPKPAEPSNVPPGLEGSTLPAEIVNRVSGLSGVHGVVIALKEGLLVAAKLPPDLQPETVAAFLPQVFSRVEQATSMMQIGELQNLMFTAGDRPWQIWNAGGVFFAVMGRPNELLPSAQIKIYAAQLARQSKG